jgi:hypothetical protein
MKAGMAALASLTISDAVQAAALEPREAAPPAGAASRLDPVADDSPQAAAIDPVRLALDAQAQRWAAGARLWIRLVAAGALVAAAAAGVGRFQSGEATARFQVSAAAQPAPAWLTPSHRPAQTPHRAAGPQASPEATLRRARPHN